MSRLLFLALLILTNQSFAIDITTGTEILGGMTVQQNQAAPTPPPNSAAIPPSNCATYYAEWSSYYAELAECAEYGCESAPEPPPSGGNSCAISIPSK